MKTITVTNLKQMSEMLGIHLNEPASITDLEDIDDTMDYDLVQVGLVGAVAPELPHRDFTIATLTQQKLDELRKGSK